MYSLWDIISRLQKTDDGEETRIGFALNQLKDYLRSNRPMIGNVEEATRSSIADSVGNPEYTPRPGAKQEMFSIHPGENQRTVKRSDLLMNEGKKIDRVVDMLGGRKISGDPAEFSQGQKKRGVAGIYDHNKNSIAISDLFDTPIPTAMNTIVHELTHARQYNDPEIMGKSEEYAASYPTAELIKKEFGSPVSKEELNAMERAYLDYLSRPTELAASVVADYVSPSHHRDASTVPYTPGRGRLNLADILKFRK